MDPEIQSYRAILNALSREWIDTELAHNMSNEASNRLFEVGKKWFHKLFQAKKDEGVSSRVPQFVHLRRQLTDKFCPEVSLEFLYKHKETGVITTTDKCTSTPISMFPPSEYEKLCEVASVKVIKFNTISFTQLALPAFNISVFIQKTAYKTLKNRDESVRFR